MVRTELSLSPFCSGFLMSLSSFWALPLQSLAAPSSSACQPSMTSAAAPSTSAKEGMEHLPPTGFTPRQDAPPGTATVSAGMSTVTPVAETVTGGGPPLSTASRHTQGMGMGMGAGSLLTPVTLQAIMQDFSLPFAEGQGEGEGMAGPQPEGHRSQAQSQAESRVPAQGQGYIESRVEASEVGVSEEQVDSGAEVSHSAASAATQEEGGRGGGSVAGTATQTEGRGSVAMPAVAGETLGTVTDRMDAVTEYLTEDLESDPLGRLGEEVIADVLTELLEEGTTGESFPPLPAHLSLPGDTWGSVRRGLGGAAEGGEKRGVGVKVEGGRGGGEREGERGGEKEREGEGVSALGEGGDSPAAMLQEDGYSWRKYGQRVVCPSPTLLTTFVCLCVTPHFSCFLAPLDPLIRTFAFSLYKGPLMSGAREDIPQVLLQVHISQVWISCYPVLFPKWILAFRCEGRRTPGATTSARTPGVP